MNFSFFSEHNLHYFYNKLSISARLRHYIIIITRLNLFFFFNKSSFGWLHSWDFFVPPGINHQKMIIHFLVNYKIDWPSTSDCLLVGIGIIMSIYIYIHLFYLLSIKIVWSERDFKIIDLCNQRKNTIFCIKYIFYVYSVVYTCIIS